MNYKCKICGNVTNNKEYCVHEMMFGLHDDFKYFQCAACDCLQIAEFPKDLDVYYPSKYYSFSSISERNSLSNPLLLQLRIRKNERIIFGALTRKILSIFFGFSPLMSISAMKLNKDSKILDVGCGSGYLLGLLNELGFKNLLGIDKFIPKDLEFKPGLVIKKGDIKIAEGKWDLVMFNHSFEHISNQFETIQSVSELLNSNGICLFNLPTVSSYAWKTYGVNWVQLDAPRHFFLHSIKSLKMLAEQANLRLKDVRYNSTDFQFWGSELYSRGLPLYCDPLFAGNRSNSLFNRVKMRKYKVEAKKLNLKYQGDQAAFYFEKVRD